MILCEIKDSVIRKIFTKGICIYIVYRVFNRPSVAAAVLQTHLEVSHWSFSSKSLKCHKSLTIRARELKLWENVHPPQHVTCDVSHVTCHVLHFNKKFKQSGEAYWWWVCYQHGLPCPVLYCPIFIKFLLPYTLHSPGCNGY